MNFMQRNKVIRVFRWLIQKTLKEEENPFSEFSSRPIIHEDQISQELTVILSDSYLGTVEKKMGGIRLHLNSGEKFFIHVSEINE